ncbi:DUF4234 domain-containing protein [Candidatus Micrarchaeota archaeon]|nr:DUF4234 domain-containing protein [Candidatus Micrarchaeota archaeon]
MAVKKKSAKEVAKPKMENPAAQPQVISGTKVKVRNPLMVVVFGFITLGIYWLYWFYETRKELYGLIKKQGNVVVDTILLFVPLVNLWVLYKYSLDIEELSKGKQNKWVILLLWIVLFPIAQYMIQEEINKHA